MTNFLTHTIQDFTSNMISVSFKNMCDFNLNSDLHGTGTKMWAETKREKLWTWIHIEINFAEKIVLFGLLFEKMSAWEDKRPEAWALKWLSGWAVGWLDGWIPGHLDFYTSECLDHCRCLDTYMPGYLVDWMPVCPSQPPTVRLLYAIVWHMVSSTAMCVSGI